MQVARSSGSSVLARTSGAPRSKKETVPGRTRPGPGGRPLAVRSAGGMQEGCGNGGKGTLPHWLSSPEHFWSPCSETGGTAEQGHGLADAGVGPMGAGPPLRRGLSGVKGESVGSKCLLPRESLALASGDKASWKHGSGTICSSDSTSPGRLWFPHRCVFMLINQHRVCLISACLLSSCDLAGLHPREGPWDTPLMVPRDLRLLPEGLDSIVPTQHAVLSCLVAEDVCFGCFVFRRG